MAKPGNVLVLGASGHVGNALIAELVAAGQRVRAATRDAGQFVARRGLQAGVDCVQLDYAEEATYPAALEGVDRLFVLTPGVVVDSEGLVAPFLEQALPRVRRVVTLTAQGVDASDEIPHRKLELRIEASGATWTHLRPTWFADNFHSYWLPQIRDGVIALPAASAKTAFIDVRDIAASARALFVGKGHEGQALVLTGPEALDYRQAAAILAERTGRPIRYTPSDDANFLLQAMRDGVPRPYAEMIVSLFGLVRAGVTAEVNDTVERVTGTPPRSLREYAATYASLLRG